MNVLVLSASPPWATDGDAGVRLRQLLRQLARRHRVWSLAYAAREEEAAPGARAELARLVDGLVEVARPRERRWLAQLLARRSQHSEAMQRELDSMLYEHGVDAVLVASTHMACFDVPPGPAVIVDASGVEAERAAHDPSALAARRRRPAGRALRRLRREELAALARADVVTVRSPPARELLLEDDPRLDVHVVEDAVDEELLQRPHASPEPRTRVFTGALHEPPDLHAARWFAEDVLPAIGTELPDARFVAAGGRVPAELEPLRSERVQLVAGAAGARQALLRAQVVVVPAREGGGARRGLLEALAAGRPVVSTTAGAAGLGLRHGEHLLLADTPNDFAREVVDLLRDPERGARLAAAGRVRVERRFVQDAVGERLETALQSALRLAEARDESHA